MFQPHTEDDCSVCASSHKQKRQPSFRITNSKKPALVPSTETVTFSNLNELLADEFPAAVLIEKNEDKVNVHICDVY